MKVGLKAIEINADFHFSQYWDGEISQSFTQCFHCLKANIPDKNIELNEVLLILVYIIIQFNIFIYSRQNF